MKFIFLLFILSIIDASQWTKLNEKLFDHISIADTILPIKITFHISLKQNLTGVKELEKLILDHLSNIKSDSYGKYLTIERINQMISPSNDDIEKVKNWLDDHDIEYKLYGDSIECSDYLDKIENLLRVKMDPYHNHYTYQLKFRSEIPYQIPSNLIGIIDFIDGICNPLTDFSIQKINLATGSDVDPGMFSREVMERLYHMHHSSVTQDVSIGVIEFFPNNGFSNKHLIRSQKANGVKANPITKNHIIGNNYFIPDIESELDTQVMFWAAPNATLWYQESENWIYSWANNFFNRLDVPEVISISYGSAEIDQCAIANCNHINNQIYLSRCNTELMKITARGITIIAASGDSGAPGSINEQCQSSEESSRLRNINPIFPGSSQWVLSVGATYIVADDQKFNYHTPICTKYTNHNLVCANGIKETATYYNETQWTTGGGFSLWLETPPWQKNDVDSYLTSGISLPNTKYFNKNGRAYPDVSTVGQNCIINTLDYYDSDWWMYVSGTSCSAPVFAGIIAQLNYAQKQRGKPILGFVSPFFYQMHQEQPEIFNDIINGVNYCTENLCCNQEFGFKATKGWDPVSGLGTPNIDKMREYLGKY